METFNDKLKKINELVDSNLISSEDYYKLRAEILEEDVISALNQNEINESNKNNSTYIKIEKKYYYALLFVFFYLSFHIVPSRLSIFPKDHFTFSDTIIFESDINKIIQRFNNADVMEKQIILQNPLINKLFEKGILEQIK
jgi:hypothetical protein